MFMILFHGLYICSQNSFCYLNLNRKLNLLGELGMNFSKIEINQQDKYIVFYDSDKITGTIQFENMYTSGTSVHFVIGQAKFSMHKDLTNELTTEYAVCRGEHSLFAYMQAFSYFVTFGGTLA